MFYLLLCVWKIAIPHFQNSADNSYDTKTFSFVLFQVYKSLLDKAGLGSITSIRFLGDQQRVFLSKDLLKPIQVYQ